MLQRLMIGTSILVHLLPQLFQPRMILVLVHSLCILPFVAFIQGAFPREVVQLTFRVFFPLP